MSKNKTKKFNNYKKEFHCEFYVLRKKVIDDGFQQKIKTKHFQSIFRTIPLF